MLPEQVRAAKKTSGRILRNERVLWRTGSEALVVVVVPVLVLESEPLLGEAWENESLSGREAWR